MSATPPEAKSEYSRGSRGSWGVFGRRRGVANGPAQRGRRTVARDPQAAIRTGLVGCALLGALLVFLAGFTTLVDLHVQNVAQPVQSLSTGSHDPGLFAIGVVAAFLAWGFGRSSSRIALLALGLLGILALVLALTRDVAQVGTTGLVMHGGRLALATATAGPGPYLETAGAALLMIAAAAGFLLLPGPAASRPRREPAAAAPAEGDRGHLC